MLGWTLSPSVSATPLSLPLYGVVLLRGETTCQALSVRRAKPTRSYRYRNPARGYFRAPSPSFARRAPVTFMRPRIMSTLTP